jgi:hypothetical protein
MGIWKSEPHSPTEKFRILCDDRDQVVSVKVEEVTVIKEEEAPKPATFMEIKNEYAVSCMFMCLQCCAQRTETQG